MHKLKGRYSSYIIMLLEGWYHCLEGSWVGNNNPVINPNQIPLGSAAGLEM